MSIIPECADYMSHITWRLAVKQFSRVNDKEVARAKTRNKMVASLVRPLINGFNQSNYDAYFNYLRNHEAEQAQRESNHTRRIRVKNAGEMFTLEQWLRICEKHDNCCARCKKFLPLTVDHIQPVSKGGTNDISNIQCLCGSCNSHKGTNNTDYRW